MFDAAINVSSVTYVSATLSIDFDLLACSFSDGAVSVSNTLTYEFQARQLEGVDNAPAYSYTASCGTASYSTRYLDINGDEISLPAGVTATSVSTDKFDFKFNPTVAMAGTYFQIEREESVNFNDDIGGFATTVI